MMPDEDDAEELLAWFDELLAVNSDPDTDLDGDDEEIGADWDLMASWGELDGEDDGGEEEEC